MSSTVLVIIIKFSKFHNFTTWNNLISTSPSLCGFFSLQVSLEIHPLSLFFFRFLVSNLIHSNVNFLLFLWVAQQLLLKAVYCFVRVCVFGFLAQISWPLYTCWPGWIACWPLLFPTYTRYQCAVVVGSTLSVFFCYFLFKIYSPSIHHHNQHYRGYERANVRTNGGTLNEWKTQPNQTIDGRLTV